MKNEPQMPQFVAEVSSNHQADLSRALQFIDCAAELGCQAVKFQLFRVRSLFAPEILQKSSKHREREAWQLPLGFLPELSARSRDKGVLLACTPFHLEAVDQLYPYVDFYKIASYELLWTDLLVACAETRKPLVLSTGMATLEEIDHAVSSYFDAGGRQLTLLHCVSGYPVPRGQCNLAAIKTLSLRYRCPVGWSDHSVSSAVICRAVHHWGASMVEFHLDIDGLGDEFSSGHCWLPDQIGSVIEEIRHSLEADGDGKKIPLASEIEDREWRTDPKDGLRPFQKVRRNWRRTPCNQ
jgi:N-acetylneuraminate synthase